MKEVYGESNLCRICNIKQILTYAKMKVQPVWIDEGYGGRLIAPSLIHNSEATRPAEISDAVLCFKKKKKAHPR